MSEILYSAAIQSPTKGSDKLTRVSTLLVYRNVAFASGLFAGFALIVFCRAPFSNLKRRL
jgi:hypothetical protein